MNFFTPRRLHILALGIALVASAAQSSAAPLPPVFHLRIASLIQPVTVGFLRSALERADAAGAGAVIVELDTPGGLMTSTHAMSEAMLAARTPVVVYVAPAGARGASAGFFLLMAADVAAMAPGTRAGAAHPVGPNGESIQGTMGQKVEQDAAAGIRSLAARNGRDAGLAQQAVVASRSWSAEEAVATHLADLVAPDVPALLAALDGRHVRKGGRDVVLHTRGAALREVEMGAGQRLLSALAQPDVAYLLLMLGGVGLFFEITHPGTLLPGAFGAVAVLLAFFGLEVLEANYLGAALILLGIGMFVAELKAGGHGVLATLGALSLISGSLVLFSSPDPELRVSMEWIAAVTVFTLLVVGSLTAVAWRVRRRPVQTGVEGLLRERGVARSDLRPRGKVFVHGETWDAVAEQAVSTGDTVEVIAVRDLTLTVRPLPLLSPAPSSAAPSPAPDSTRPFASRP
jgi:membrane-bound serine protease (ClpP class)